MEGRGEAPQRRNLLVRRLPPAAACKDQPELLLLGAAPDPAADLEGLQAVEPAMEPGEHLGAETAGDLLLPRARAGAHLARQIDRDIIAARRPLAAVPGQHQPKVGAAPPPHGLRRDKPCPFEDHPPLRRTWSEATLAPKHQLPLGHPGAELRIHTEETMQLVQAVGREEQATLERLANRPESHPGLINHHPLPGLAPAPELDHPRPQPRHRRMPAPRAADRPRRDDVRRSRIPTTTNKQNQNDPQNLKSGKPAEPRPPMRSHSKLPLSNKLATEK